MNVDILEENFKELISNINQKSKIDDSKKKF